MNSSVNRLFLSAALVFSIAPASFGSGQNLHPVPSSRGCPVQMVVKELREGGVLPVSPKRVGINYVQVELSGKRIAQIESITLSVHGSSASDVLNPASVREDTNDRVKTFTLSQSNNRDGKLVGKTSIDWQHIRRVQVDFIEYRQSPSWHPSNEEYCVEAPNGTLLLSSMR